MLRDLRGARAGQAAGSPEIVKATARHKSGRVIPVELSMSFTEDERAPLLVAFVRDVSRRAAEESELIEARDRAVAGEKAKAKMIAVMSHEMRTPLNGVMGTLDLLKTTVLDPRQQRYLEAMERSGRTLLRHVNDVLDASRARSDQITFSAAPVDLRSLVSETIEGLQVQARQHGNRLSVAFVGDQQHSVMGDATRLEQIVVNLVGNAIKFTENGAIHVDLNRSAGGGRIELRVTDTGIGIAEQDLDRIFDEFVTLGATFDRRVQGTGLGLSIVKGLIDAMGGEIDVVSEPGAGTAFHVSLDLPLAEAVAVPSFAGTPAGLSCAGLTVLVVEDNEINRLVAGEMLCQSGCQVVEAEDGVEGVAAAGRRPFDLILMDISMPRLNGVDATRAIRAGGPNRKTPIVALTAHATPEDLARFRAAGMEDSLTKPLRRADLVATLAGAAATQAPAPDRHTSDDLVQCLGEAQARVLTDRVLMEIRDGLDRLARGDAGASSDGAALAHRLAGSAAVAGLRDLHQGLISLEQGLRAGGHGAAPRHLTAPLIAILEKLSVKSSLKPARDARQA